MSAPSKRIQSLCMLFFNKVQFSLSNSLRDRAGEKEEIARSVPIGLLSMGRIHLFMRKNDVEKSMYAQGGSVVF